MYNTDVFPEAPTSWDVTFEKMDLPDGKSNEGRIQAYDGPIYIADAALYLKYHKPELGIENPYDLTEEQFNAVVELLTAQRPLINRYWHDAYVQMDDFANEGVVASGSWPFQVNFMTGVSVSSVVPVEGATGWADTTMMHVDAKHPNCAYKWLEWSLNPKLQGDLASWFGSVPSVPAACQGNELLGDTGCATNGFDNFDKIWFWRTPTAECSTGAGNCVPYSKWVEAYVGIISGGQ
jgi:putative spermidine/putrescine transport system substrate-binding protein